MDRDGVVVRPVRSKVRGAYTSRTTCPSSWHGVLAGWMPGGARRWPSLNVTRRVLCPWLSPAPTESSIGAAPEHTGP